MRHCCLSLLLLACVAAGLSADEIMTPPAPDESVVQDDRGGDVGGCEFCDCCCPSWCGRVNYVQMRRERTDSDFAVWEDGADNPLYTADRFDIDPASGIDASLFWENECGQGFEFRYLGLEDHDARETVNFGVQSRPATNPEFSALFAVGDLNFSYESQLQSFALLSRQSDGCTTLTYGFRYVDLDETVRIDNAPLDDVVLFQARNQLYGFQVGVDRHLWDNGCGLSLQGLGKAGVYYNRVDVASSFNFGGSGQNSADEVAFIGELGLTGRYEMNCRLTLLAGYQLLFLDGVTLAADQVPNTGNVNTPGNVPVNVDSSSLLYHGLNVGIERCW